MRLEFGAIGISVIDIKTMVEFYRNVIGLDMEWDGGPFAGVRMSSGVFFNLYQDEHIRRPEGINKTFQVTCATVNGEELTPDDVDKEYSRMIQAGALSVIPPRDEPYGMRIAYVADPEGNQIEICCPLED